jgi:acyl-CoA thioester hydrolase
MDDAPGRQSALTDALGNAAEPLGLREDRLSGEAAGHVNGESTMPMMDGYRFTLPREVEFRDVDAADHVNNAVYLTYLETARIRYLLEVLGADFAYQLSLILAHITVDFRSPALFPETLEIRTRVTRVGTKSFDMQHEIRGGDGRLVLEASTVLVAYDYEADAPMAVPDDWRARLDAYEERSSVAT